MNAPNDSLTADLSDLAGILGRAIAKRIAIEFGWEATGNDEAEAAIWAAVEVVAPEFQKQTASIAFAELRTDPLDGGAWA